MAMLEKAITNGDYIRAMSDEKLADFLDSLAYARETPWSYPFNIAFCESCPTVHVKLEGYHQELDLCECDFVDGKCPHGSNIIWWLQQPVSDGGDSDG